MGKKIDDKTLLQLASKQGYNTNKPKTDQLVNDQVTEVPKGSGKYFKVVDDGSKGPGHTDSGFDAMVMQEVDGPGQDAKPISDPIMVIEGSNTLDPNAEKGPNGRPNDMKESDVPLGMGKTPQSYHDAEAYYQYLKNVKKINVKQVTGNSLGGGHSSYLGMLHPELDVVASNPAPVPEELLENAKGSGDNIRIVRTSSDPLSTLNRIAGLKTPGKDVTVSTESVELLTNLVIVKTPEGKYTTIDINKEKEKIWASMGVNSKAEYDALPADKKTSVDQAVAKELEKYGTPVWYAHLGASSQNPDDNMPQDITKIAPFSMLTGEAISLETASGGTIVEINYKELAAVATSLKGEQLQKISEVEGVLTGANDLVVTEKNQLATRTNKFQEHYETMIRKNMGLDELHIQIGKTNEELDKALAQVDCVMVAINSIMIIIEPITELSLVIPIVGPFIAGIYKVCQGIVIVADIELIKAHQIVNRVKKLINNFDDSVKQSTQNVAKIVDDVNNVMSGENDAVAAALTSYYKVIPESVDVVQANVTSFSNSVISTAEAMEQTDKNLRKMISDARITTEKADTERQRVELDKLLESQEIIMAKNILESKQKVLDENFTKLKSETTKLIYGILSELYDVVEEIKDFAELIKAELNPLLAVQVCKIDDVTKAVMEIAAGGVAAAGPAIIEGVVRVNNGIYDVQEAIRNVMKYINGALDLSKLGLKTINDIKSGDKIGAEIERLKPSISVAMFAEEKLSSVITMQNYALDLSKSLETVFQNLTYQLKNQKSSAISALSNRSVEVEASLQDLHKQIGILLMTN